ncbi:MAG: apolipoprotein N-acyltransferase [Bordetella sp.]|nr:MAG: apolipoprotein N-acyltransferase [Bordetella sp.]
MKFINLKEKKLFLFLVLLGCFHGLSFSPDPLPSWSLSFVQIFTLSLLAYLTLNVKNGKIAFIRAWIFGTFNFVTSLYWIYIGLHFYADICKFFAIFSLFILSAFLSLYSSIACFLAYILNQSINKNSILSNINKILIWAALWSLFEWLRGNLFTGFPWSNIAYAHISNPISNWSTLLGMYGLSFIAAIFAGCISVLFTAKKNILKKQILFSGVIITTILLIGISLKFIQWSEPMGKIINAYLVQGNIEQSKKFDVNQIEQNILHHIKLLSSFTKEDSEPSWIIFSETVLPIFQNNLPIKIWNEFLKIVYKSNKTLIIGVPLRRRINDRVFHTNSAIAIDSHTSTNDLIKGCNIMRYDKKHLVPFGEFIPNGFYWLNKIITFPLTDFEPGKIYQKPFIVNNVHILINICYENLFPQEILSSLKHNPDYKTNNGGDIIINMSNLGWFGNTWALRQYLQINRLFAIQIARPILSSANTGITAFIDPKGKVIAQLPQNNIGILNMQVQGMTGNTPYTIYGDYPIIFLLMSIILSRSYIYVIQTRTEKFD